MHAMGNKSSLTEVQRAQIVALHGEGYTDRDTAAKICCSKSVAHNAIIKFTVDGTYLDREKSGHPWKMNSFKTSQQRIWTEIPQAVINT